MHKSPLRRDTVPRRFLIIAISSTHVCHFAPSTHAATAWHLTKATPQIACMQRVDVHAACALLVNTALQQPCLAQLSSDPLPSPYTAAQMPPSAACPRRMLLTPASTDRRQREELALIIKEAPHHASKPSMPIEDMSPNIQRLHTPRPAASCAHAGSAQNLT